MELKFINLDINLLNKIKDQLYKNNSYICDYTLAILYMRKDYYDIKIAFINEKNNEFILKAKYDLENNKYMFYFPFSSDIQKSIDLINEYALKNKIFPLEYTCLNMENVEKLKDFYKHYYFHFDRMWSDYIYKNNDFVEFKGKKYQNKRHFVSRFKRLYLLNENIDKGEEIKEKHNIEIIKYENKLDDVLLLKCFDFIDEFKKDKFGIEGNNEEIGIKEEDFSKEILKVFYKLNLTLFIMVDNKKIIGLSLVEIVNDTLFDHLEKCNKKYFGIVPYFVNYIATFYQDKVIYFNREDDSGDLGLRKSKEDYHPFMMIHKYAFKVLNNMTLLTNIPTLKVNDDIFLEPLNEKNKENYYLLSIDEKRNKYWGYDYKSDLKENQIPDSTYFFNMVKNDFLNKENTVFIINFKNNFAGELVIHNYLNDNSVEIGIRLIEEMENKNIAFNVVSFILSYLKNELCISKARMKCYKENKKSDKLITRLNFKFINSDEIYNNYELIL